MYDSRNWPTTCVVKQDMFGIHQCKGFRGSFFIYDNTKNNT